MLTTSQSNEERLQSNFTEVKFMQRIQTPEQTTELRPPGFYQTELDYIFIMTQEKSVIVITIRLISEDFWTIIEVFWPILFININNILNGTITSMDVNRLETVYIFNTN